ncbi:MAG: DUF4159 domain-containing protein [Phycisphaerales bacterium]
MRRIIVILMVLAWASPCPAAVTSEQLSGAINRMQTYLLSLQDPATGGFDQDHTQGSTQYGGESALVTYALLRSGMSPQEPRIQAAVEHLKKIHMNGTYAISLRTHCWAALSDDYRPQMAEDARWLARAQVNGLFDYGYRTGPRFDHSVTQYGLLGLWESTKRRGPNPGRVWQQAAQHFINEQNPDGGWGYTGGDTSTPSMTAAGLTALLIAQENLYRTYPKPPANITQAIDRGAAWLDHYSSANGVTVTDGMYYLVSLERAALANGTRLLGGEDWFQAAAQSILDREAGSGTVNGKLVDTAFALMFLSRGSVPVWINKLRLRDQAWNNHPNDLNLFTRRLSDQVETQLGWQVIDADADTSLWLDAPVAYIASDAPINFTSAELANLKTYLDLGGVLVATPDGNPKVFGESIREAAARIYPAYTFKQVEAEHPLMGLVYEADVSEDDRPWVLSNGVRDLIVLAPTDWGMSLQSGRSVPRTGAEEIMANLHALVTDRGDDGVRLEPSWVEPQDRPKAGLLRVLRINEPGTQPLEPLAWQPLINRFFNQTGIGIEVNDVSIDQLEETEAPLVYLGGSAVKRLTAQELRLLTGYVQRGGTVLIETIGGRGDFTQEMLRQFEAVFGGQAAILGANHPVVAGKGFGETVGDIPGEDMRRVTFRRYSNLTRGQIDAPRLLSINLDGRAAVIASNEDLSLGVMGCRHWGIDGYDTDAARGLLTNILLYAVGDTVLKDRNPAPAEAPDNPQIIESP